MGPSALRRRFSSFVSCGTTFLLVRKDSTARVLRCRASRRRCTATWHSTSTDSSMPFISSGSLRGSAEAGGAGTRESPTVTHKTTASSDRQCLNRRERDTALRRAPVTSPSCSHCATFGPHTSPWAAVARTLRNLRERVRQNALFVSPVRTFVVSAMTIRTNCSPRASPPSAARRLVKGSCCCCCARNTMHSTWRALHTLGGEFVRRHAPHAPSSRPSEPMVAATASFGAASMRPSNAGTSIGFSSAASQLSSVLFMALIFSLSPAIASFTNSKILFSA
mmetsp:Transcript_35098/g.70180  ORF Transcript_35098/g.70180 Transcript_35098/m.70180 type:complete len:279 (+) Transcript_35098:1319-2155(+)